MQLTRTCRLAIAPMLGLATAVSFGVVMAGSAAAATIDVVRPGESIQAAIDAANPGDTIVVLSGTYTEGVSITTSGISLTGLRATLQPPGGDDVPPCGVCIGDFTLGPDGVTVNDPDNPVTGVSVSGFTVTDFAFGIFAAGADQTLIRNNRLEDNPEYGVFANHSTNTTISRNVASGSEEAGIYVGDSPNANARIVGNDASGAEFGIFVRHAEHGTIVANRLHDNCVGALFLADAPGPAGAFDLSANFVTRNTKFCDGDGEGDPAVSGVGIALVGAHDVDITANVIADNLPGGPPDITGGVIVVGGFGGTAPVNNTVTRNVIVRNAPDIVLGPEATDTVVANNLCQTSQPSGLCSS